MQTALNTLAELDPAPRTTPTDAAARRRDAMLERILAAPQTAPTTARPPRTTRVVRRVALGAAALAIAVPTAVIGTHLVARQLDPASHGLSDADLAGWVSTGTPQTASQLSTAAKQWCITATDRQAGHDAAVRILGGEERGAVASMLVQRAGNLDICLANRAGGGGYWELVSNPSMPLPAIGRRAVLLQSAGEQGSNDVGTAWGQAGTDIRTITIRLDDREIETTVINGIWNAWWPDATSTDLPTTATVTYTDGSTATVPVHTP